MGRPTSEKKDRKVDLRISQELYDELAKEGSVSAVIRDRIVSQNKIPSNNFVAQNENPFNSAVGKDLLDMLSCFRKTSEDFVRDAHDLMEQGILTYQNGTLTIELGFDYQAFLDFCTKRKANPATVWKNLGKEIGF
jgi:hypothetical protein